MTRRREEGGEGRRRGGGGRSRGEGGHRRRPEGTPQPRLYRARYVKFFLRAHHPYSTVESCRRERGAGIRGAFAFAFLLSKSASCRSRLPLPSSLHPYDGPVFRGLGLLCEGGWRIFRAITHAVAVDYLFTPHRFMLC